jgi:small subunit ribosomal protein S18
VEGILNESLRCGSLANAHQNPALLAEFMSSMGRIKHPKETGLRPVNQRKVAKAIRRAIGMGFHPSVHAHPELLRRRRTDHTFR